ncbi:tyrosine-type recombinase/integrase [Peribacillus muralis]|uniref:tyrosine-type recombinase/integrase n=1 Tax=Peribacillus muralis TaxID=264697 RepID=UPI0037F88615
MASFTKRGSTWQYTVSRMVNGKPKPIRKSGFRTKKEAQVAAAEVEAKLIRGILPHLTPVPIDEYFEKWVKLYKSNLSTTTQEHYKYTLKTIIDHFGNTPLQDINRHSYQLFLNQYGATRARETVEKLNSHIKACVRDAFEEGIIQLDFTRKASLTWTTPSKKSNEKHLSFKESEVLINELYKRLDNGLGYYLLLLGLTSGMRFGEMVGLTRKDFDFDNNLININKTWGYMRRTSEGFGPTKNEQSNRIIRMDKPTMRIFEKLFLLMPTNLHQLVFFSPTSKYKVISNTNANKLLKKVLTDLKIEPITVHGLRHTHASVLLYKKVSIYYVSERLGHKDIETTLKDYTHVIKELREEDERETIHTFEEMVV